ncbi:nucleus protein [Papiliotrema laurentii]|uniref:Nucleus protein n=1 Tax=Papiliotrema laurentii TaxID=5418 RepID=A0AAD9CT95_PAPLA|nr:nucleus protein [Papiliotrema laurentii]
MSAGPSRLHGASMPRNLELHPPVRRRRVPDELRQRSENSCDRCKKRKRKCVRADDASQCAACEEAGDECRTTLPRKRKAAGSEASARYALLDSIVRKIYPEEDVESVEGLASLARRLGASVGLDTVEMDETRPRASPEAVDIRADMTTGGDIPKTLLPEGWLVPAPRGGYHYVGPSSLISFARDARRLVAKSKILNQPTYDEEGMRRYVHASEFTNYKVSHSLEANIENHPAMVAATSEAARSVASEPSPHGSGVAASPGDICSTHRVLSHQLVNAYFDRVHPNFPVLHRGAFQVQYERKSVKTQLAGDPGWACTLYMVYVLGAQAMEKDLALARQVQEQYLSLVVPEGLGRITLTSTLSNIQALLLLALYQHNAGERNTAWSLTGHAVRIAVAMGLHRDGEHHDFDPFDRNIRRSVWWTLHVFEQYLSLALGRPSFTDAIVSDAKLPEVSFETGLGLPAGYLAHCVSLSWFVTRIKQTVAIASASYSDPPRLSDLSPTVLGIHGDLIAWKKSLPLEMSLGQRFDSPTHRRLVVILLISADYLESVLCRPFLLCRVDRELSGQSVPAVIEEIAEHTISAAHAAAIKLLLLEDHGLLEGSVWLDFYAVQHCIMITSLHLLGRPHDPEGESLRDDVLRLFAASERIDLAPTYRLTMKVAYQLACIAGVVSDGLRADQRVERSGEEPVVPTMTSIPVSMSRDSGQYTFKGMPDLPDRSEADLFADFLSLNNQGNDAEVFADWNFFDMPEFTGLDGGEGFVDTAALFRQ